MGGVIGKVYTYPKGHDLEIEWKIEDFLSFYNDDKSMYNSPSFSFKDIQWNFMIRMDLGSYYHLSLCRDSSSPPTPIFLHISIALKTLNGQKFRERYFPTTKCDPKCRTLFHPLISKTGLAERKYELLPSDVLTVICTMKLPTSAEIASAVATAKRPLFPLGKKRITIKSECPECFNVTFDFPGILEPVCRKCELAKAGPPPIVTCYDCNMNVEDIELHKKKCLNKPIKCPECSSVVLLQDWFDHKCQMAIAQGEASKSSVSSIFDEKVLLDFKELFLKKEDCDVVIKVKDQEFPAHKNILKARSPVFASTFRSGMKEKATSVVKIDDCDPSSFSDFLCFLYCGDMRIISKDNVFCLFTAAVKYNVQDLKTKCVEFMKENLSIDTFCDTFTTALQHSEAELMKITTNYFTKNAPKIIITPKWQSFLAENPADSNELLVKLLVNNRSSSK